MSQQDVMRDVVCYLAERGKSVSEDDQESLQLAIQLLSTVFEVAPSSPGACDLLEVYQKGMKVVEGERAARPEFYEYIQLLRSKGYFAGCSYGSDEYAQRLEMAEGKWKEIRKGNEGEKEEERAEALKLQGNEALKAGDLEKAIDFYGQAIDLFPKAIYYCNRAAVYQRKGAYDQGLKDCKEAITLDHKYVKAYVRLGQCLYHLGKIEDAIALGFDKALELDASNSSALEGKQLAMNKAQPVEKAETPPSFDGLDMNALMNHPMVSQMMSNPAMQNMVNNIMSNPESMNMFNNLAQNMNKS